MSAERHGREQPGDGIGRAAAATASSARASRSAGASSSPTAAPRSCAGLAGPPGRADAAAPARLGRQRRPQLVPGRSSRCASTSTSSPPTCAATRAGLQVAQDLPARRLRRRLRGDARRARHRPGHRGRLLDGRPGRAAAVAPPPRPRRRTRAVRDERRLRAEPPHAQRVPGDDARARPRWPASRGRRVCCRRCRWCACIRRRCRRGPRPRCAATTGA